MQSIPKEELRKMLPQGCYKEIAKRAGTTPQSVANYFNKRNNSIKIELASMEVMAEINEKRKSLIERLK